MNPFWLCFCGLFLFFLVNVIVIVPISLSKSKEKKVVPGTALAKPQHLVQYEQKKGRSVGGAGGTTKASPNGSSGNSTVDVTPSPASTPKSTVAPSAPSNGTPPVGGPGKSLLASFGTVAL